MAGLVESVRRPEYTGERRCWPCTLVNLVLLAVACGVLAALGRPVAAVALAVVGVAVVAVRGYLVPYTPRFAPRLVALLPGDPFHAGAGERDAGPAGGPEETADRTGTLADGADAPDADAVLEALVAAGVVEATPERVSLDGAVLDDWEAEMAALRSLDGDALAETVAAESPAARVEAVRQEGRTWVVLSDADGSPASQVWLSRPVAVAETAATRALEGRISDDGTRLAAGAALRGFLVTCPVCEVELAETTTADCCGGMGWKAVPDPVLACPSCDARLYTLPAEE